MEPTLRNCFFNGAIGQLEAILSWFHRLRHLSCKSSLKFLRFSFGKISLRFCHVRADFFRGRRPSVKMARRVGAARPPFTFENQSEFFRKVPTEMDFGDRQGGRSQRPPPLRAPQSPVYIRKKDAG